MRPDVKSAIKRFSVFALLVGAIALLLLTDIGRLGNHAASESKEIHGRDTILQICGYGVRSSLESKGYDLEEWRQRDCESLDDYDRCFLQCMSDGRGTEISGGCNHWCRRFGQDFQNIPYRR